MPFRTVARVARVARAALALALMALLLVACSGGAPPRGRVPLAPSEKVEIVYVDGANRWTLRSADSVDDATYQRRGLYGNDVSPDVKFADRGSLQALLDGLHELGHFDRAAAQARPDARVMLRVHIGDKETIWSQPPLQPDNMRELEQFNAARLAVLQVHNNIISYHASSMSKTDFDRSIAEQNEKNQEAVRNVLDKARGRQR
jgi:hypothetical protein